MVSCYKRKWTCATKGSGLAFQHNLSVSLPLGDGEECGRRCLEGERQVKPAVDGVMLYVHPTWTGFLANVNIVDLRVLSL